MTDNHVEHERVAENTHQEREQVRHEMGSQCGGNFIVGVNCRLGIGYC